MSSRLVRQSLSLLTLLACLLAGPGGTSAYVLCLGADGHAALELGHENDCGRTGGCPTPAQEPPHCDRDAAHGAPCTDITSTLSSHNTRNKPTLSLPPAATPALFVTATPPLLSSLPAPRPSGCATILPLGTTLLVLRSTVIRC